MNNSQSFQTENKMPFRQVYTFTAIIGIAAGSAGRGLIPLNIPFQPLYFTVQAKLSGFTYPVGSSVGNFLFSIKAPSICRTDALVSFGDGGLFSPIYYHDLRGRTNLNGSHEITAFSYNIAGESVLDNNEVVTLVLTFYE